MKPPPQDVHAIVEGILSPRPTRAATLRFVDLAHRFATAYLVNQRICDPLMGASGKDLALDMIADMFERDRSGRYTVIATYYEARDWEALTERELWTTTRRFVLGRINDAIFRIYREADPSLARIIRNVKRAVDLDPSLAIERKRRSLWIRHPGRPDSSESLPSWPREVFQAYLMARVNATTQVTSIVGEVARIFEDDGIYAPAIPVSMLARIIRDASAQLHSDSFEDPQDSTGYESSELLQLINRSIARLRQNRRGFYVHRGKLSESEYTNLFSVIREQLTHAFVGGDGIPSNNHMALARHIPGLSEDAYRRKYRNILEYLHRCTRRDFIENLRHDLEISARSSYGEDYILR